ncbi:TetR/AcrR family transcriptional regulator [Streptomyces sp. J2-1]|uniref:TetR/AcrR family transcriptional regulator n=1 Tax=Streptomyces corallincola TaxID=2851888 RepID=UPI001C3884A1|nr:TetR/AcrR family transcriptional regulator [Streptomyces corallincola]MBV2353817.1 TetR/AcrR family transcriptional regulator [Streptomyces corallincola]
MNARATVISVAARLLDESATGDVSTRAVCEAAGIQQPVLYRLFGDKEGLLSSTVDHIWDQYLESKRQAEKSADPVVDLRSGWDSHTAFALTHPNAYKLMFAPGLRTVPQAVEEAIRILRDVLNRLAAEGRLRVPPQPATQMVMAANTGIALALVTRPTLYPDQGVSTLVRDAIHRAILVEAPGAESGGSAVRDARTSAVTTLRASLGELTPEPFTPVEAALLDQWLTQIPHSGEPEPGE